MSVPTASVAMLYESPLIFAGLLRLAENPASLETVLATLWAEGAPLPADPRGAREALARAASQFLDEPGGMGTRTMLRLESLFQKALVNKSYLLAARIALYQAKATRAFERAAQAESVAEALREAGEWLREFGEPSFTAGEGI